MGLSAERVLRCLLLKQQLRISYKQLAFHLSDSVTCRAFAWLGHFMPRRAGLQSTIRRIRPDTLERAYRLLTRNLLDQDVISLDTLRVDSTVVASHIAPPSDSQLSNDTVRVISHPLATSQSRTGVKLRFVNQRKPEKSLAFRIFNAKKTKIRDTLSRLAQYYTVGHEAGEL
jgi:IS5 family transposase